MKVFAVAEGEKLFFILDDGTIYKMYNLEHTISSSGGGAIGLTGSRAPGVSLNLISEEDPNLNKLRCNRISKVRLYTTDGYVEADVSQKNSERVQNALKLIDNLQ